ncbi:hypothetical protein M0802_011506 [Mischocyttarus mexicanus]|nr:hypothetical protein M0802_011506 [Mischocyttarus mexicanus]
MVLFILAVVRRLRACSTSTRTQRSAPIRRVVRKTLSSYSTSGMLRLKKVEVEEEEEARKKNKTTTLKTDVDVRSRSSLAARYSGRDRVERLKKGGVEEKVEKEEEVCGGLTFEEFKFRLENKF